MCIILSRLNHDRHGGAWCPKPAIAEDVKEWLQVDLGAVHVVTGIVTQVRMAGISNYVIDILFRSREFLDTFYLLITHSTFLHNMPNVESTDMVQKIVPRLRESRPGFTQPVVPLLPINFRCGRRTSPAPSPVEI